MQLRGMSLYWSQWIPKYYTANTVKWLRDNWKVTVVRAAMAVKPDGYGRIRPRSATRSSRWSMPQSSSVST